jgi:hypothetical protein
MKNAAHFAHAKGEAAPDCEDYFPSAFVYRGRRSTWETLETTERPADSLDLYIEVLATGPRLLLWVPPVENEVAWGGVLQITTQRLTRSLTARHLQRGQFVSFDLVDSTWTVSIDGDVPEDYLSRIDVGPGSLETELNLFDATHSPGRKLGAAAAVRLGDAVWLVTRNPPTPTATANSPATWKRVFEGAGWSLFYVELPREATPAEVTSLSRELQRRIRPSRARVWIERPWPVAFRDGNIPIIVDPGEGIEICADSPVDIGLRGSDGQVHRPTAEQSTTLTATNLSRGRWDVLINGVSFLRFEIVADETRTTASLKARVNGGPPLELARAQQAIERILSTEGSVASIALLWEHEAVGALVRIDGASLSVERLSAAFTRGSGLITVDNLGTLKWKNAGAPASHQPVRADVLRRVRGRARWLLTIALTHRSPTAVKIALPAPLLDDPLVAKLNGLSLPPAFTPHVNALARDARFFV